MSVNSMKVTNNFQYINIIHKTLQNKYNSSEQQLYRKRLSASRQLKNFASKKKKNGGDDFVKLTIRHGARAPRGGCFCCPHRITTPLNSLVGYLLQCK